MQKTASRLFPSLIIIFFWLTLFSSAQALVMPAVYLIDLKIGETDFQPGDQIKGVFTVWNTEERIVNDITYKYLLFIKDETGIPKVYIDEKVSQERFNLSPGEKRNFSYSYELPQNISSGRYSFRIALSLSGFPLGWEEREINIIGEGPFLLIDRPFIIKNNIAESAVAGINFEKGEVPRLKFRIQNPSKEVLRAAPKITIFERDTSQLRIEAKGQAEITLKPQQSLDLTYTLPLYEKPESYLAELQFFDKENLSLSNKLFFRWVVIGLSGEIIEATANKEKYQKGETAEITVFITGPADIATEPGQGEVEVTLLSPDNILVGKNKKTIDLSKGYHTLTVPIERDISQPIIKVELKKENIVLDDYTVKTGLAELLAEKPEELPKNRLILYFLIGLLVIVSGALLYYFLRKRGLIKIIILLILIGGGFFVALPQITKAAVVEFKQAAGENYIAITWNKPLKNEAFVTGEYITFQGAFFIPVCLNALVKNTIVFYITDYQHQPPVFYASSLPTRESEEKKKELLTFGNWLELGRVYYEGHAAVGLTVEYNQTFKIPDQVPSGNVYSRVWFEGAHWDPFKNKYNLIVSEDIKINNPPSANNLNITQPDYCIISWPAAIFSWSFTDPNGDTQSAYQLQVDNNSSFSSPEVDSGKVISSSNSFATQAGQLSFNNTYYWRLMVWDSKDLSSPWISGSPFTVPKHAYPSINFSWTPQNPSVNENTQFTDQSIVYGGSTKSSWSWAFQGGNPANSALQNPIVKFLSTGTKSVTLRVADSDGFSCQPPPKTINSQLPLPDWIEIPPF